MYRRITTDGTGNWSPLNLSGLLNSANIQIVGVQDGFIAAQEDQPDADFWTMLPGDIKDYENWDTEGDHPGKIQTTKLWFRDGGVATIIEFDWTTKEG